MTQTSITAADARTAAFHLGHLGHLDEGYRDATRTMRQQYLELIGLSKQELEALEAGMHGQGPEDRARQNRAWSIQNAAQLEIVRAALADGVPSDAITAITHRESW
jgi:hypothetical protein